MNNSKWVTVVSVAALSLWLGVFSACSESKAVSGSAVLVVTGNVHSQLDPCG
ncbi:MAG: hypothetical protein V3U24_05345 [Candidatus Neomarinimicrobiota bacterium]